jgi:hypothetical protein
MQKRERKRLFCFYEISITKIQALRAVFYQYDNYFDFPRNKRNQPGGDRGSLADSSASLVRQSGSLHSYHHLGGMGHVSGAVGGTSMAVAKSVSSSSVVCKVPQQQQQQPPVAGVTAESHHNHSKSHHPTVLQDNSDPSSITPSQNTAGGPSQRSDSDDNSYRQSREASTNKEPMPPR